MKSPRGEGDNLLAALRADLLRRRGARTSAVPPRRPSGPPLSMEAKIRAALANYFAVNDGGTAEMVGEVVSAVLTEAAVYATDREDVPEEVSKRLDWQIEQLEIRALAALKGLRGR